MTIFGTPFSRLSPEAQHLIVSALMGEYTLSGPPEISPAVKAEIEAWGKEDEGTRP